MLSDIFVFGDIACWENGRSEKVVIGLLIIILLVEDRLLKLAPVLVLLFVRLLLIT